MDELNVMRAKYATLIEDGKKIEAFTALSEWQWYVDKVITPTVDEYMERILSGKLPEREDLVIRGMINGLRLVVESTTTFKDNALKAKEQAKELEKQVKDNE